MYVAAKERGWRLSGAAFILSDLKFTRMLK
jgi:hypothetical protein